MRKRFISRRAAIRYLKARSLTGYAFRKVGRWWEIVSLVTLANAARDTVDSHNVKPREIWHSGSVRPIESGILTTYVDTVGGSKQADGKRLNTEYPSGYLVSHT